MKKQFVHLAIALSLSSIQSYADGVEEVPSETQEGSLKIEESENFNSTIIEAADVHLETQQASPKVEESENFNSTIIEKAHVQISEPKVSTHIAYRE